MSLRWIEQLVRRRTHRVRVYLGTRHVTVDLIAGWRTRNLARGVSVAHEGSIDAALAALAEALREVRRTAGSLRGLACELVLADGWIVYDVVTLDLLRVTPASAATAVGAALADVAGVRAESLDVRWQWQRDGRSVFAMAVAHATLARLRGTLASAGLQLGSLTGEFIAVYNAQRPGFTGRRIVLAVGREGGAQIAVLVDGVIRATRFELGSTGGVQLSNAAAGVMRERGDDTTTPTDYVLDAVADTGHEPIDPRWARVRPPAWTAVRQGAPVH